MPNLDSVFKRFKSPAQVQTFLDAVPYSDEERYRCPASVVRDRKAHCFDGAIFAAAALRQQGFVPLIVDLFADNDDDHLLALYKQGTHWGAVAKSNFANLRFREPVYRSVRELVMSYFNDYYNLNREKTLRGYYGPLNLRGFDKWQWEVNDAPLDVISDRLGEVRQVTLVTRAMARKFQLLDARSFEAGMVGTDLAGVYKPPNKGGA